MKSFFVLIFLALTVLVAAEDRHHEEWGERQDNDLLLDTKVLSCEWGFLCKKTEDYTYKPKDIKNAPKITYVKVHDRCENGNGGNVKLTSGGIGYTSITLQVTSQRNRGYHFVINIYGK